MTLADVADVSGVRRPVVTMWRRRDTAAGRRVPFPQPVTRLAGTEVFSADEVVAWLERTGRGNNADARGDLYAHVGLPRVGVSQVAALDGAMALLVLQALTGGPLGGRTAEEIVDLADEVDPDDDVLFSEIDALGSDLAGLAGFVDELADAAYGVAGALARLESLAGSATVARIALQASARQLVGAVGAALGLDLASPRIVVLDPTGGSADLVDAVMQGISERVDATVTVPSGQTQARRARRAHLVRGWSLTTAPSGAGPVLAVARFPHALRPRMSAADILTAVDAVQLELAPRHRAVVLAPAAVLCDALDDPVLETRRDRLLRLGRLRCAVRLPKGLVVGSPRQALGLWVLGPQVSGPLQQRMLSTADVSDERLSAAVIDGLVSDAVASTGTWESVAHAFRFARPARASALLAGGGPLVPVGARPAPLRTESAAERVVTTQTLLASLAAAGGARHTGLGALRVDPGVAGAGMPSTTVAAALADGSVRLLRGTRVEADELGDDGVRVITLADLEGQEPPQVRRIDPIELEQRYPRARRTEPGDVVFTTTPRPMALVDRAGGSVVAYPARILRCANDSGVVPEVVAYVVESRAEEARAWRTWLVPRVGPGAAEGLAGALQVVADERAAARHRMRDLDRLAGLFVEGNAAGALVVRLDSPVGNDADDPLTEEGP